jgi:hypothetical protein
MRSIGHRLLKRKLWTCFLDFILRQNDGTDGEQKVETFALNSKALVRRRKEGEQRWMQADVG